MRDTRVPGGDCRGLACHTFCPTCPSAGSDFSGFHPARDSELKAPPVVRAAQVQPQQDTAPALKPDGRGSPRIPAVSTE